MFKYKHREIGYNSEKLEAPRWFIPIFRDGEFFEVGADYYFDNQPPYRIVEVDRWDDGNGFDEDEARELIPMAQQLVASYYAAEGE